MRWNWQQPDWPAFSYASDALEPLERRFLLAAGELIGAFRHVGRDDHDQLRVELIVDEALKTSEIEGEMGDSHVGLQARLMSQALRKMTGALKTSNTTAIQFVRVPGGNAG